MKHTSKYGMNIPFLLYFARRFVVGNMKFSARIFNSYPAYVENMVSS